MSFRTLILLILSIRLAIAGYVLQDSYTPSNFFDQFNFFTSSDPTHGFVKYVDQTTARQNGFIVNNANTAYIGVDHKNVQPGGRPSVRLTSKKSYNKGLVILDLEHMPGGICGTWPAFWMVGPNWPSSGEIDIIEGVNEQTANDMTLHTGPGCSISNNHQFTANFITPNCDVNAPGQASNQGCQIASASTATYGTGFNSYNGGVFATLWTADAISIYFWRRDHIPSDISSGHPNPSTWDAPRAKFSGPCDINSKFKDLQIVFDTTFCGDWAGGVWGSGSCASKARTCNEFVANNPQAFANAYWSVKSLKVYQQTSSKARDENSLSLNRSHPHKQRHLRQYSPVSGFHTVVKPLNAAATSSV